MGSTTLQFEIDEKRAISPDSHIEHKDKRNDSACESPYPSTAYRPCVTASAAERARRNINARLANPLAHWSYQELRKMGRAYAYDNALADQEDVRAFEIGACLAREPENLSQAKELGVTDEEFEILSQELTNRWKQPWTLYVVIVLCSTCAAVQGMGTASSLSFHIPPKSCRARRLTCTPR